MRILLFLLLLLPAQAMAAGAPRILALSPHICEILYAIGAGDEVVGAVDHCDYPVQAKRLPRVGSYLQVYVEEALRTRPTLAIALDGNLPGMSQLAAHGVRIAISNPHSVEGMIADVRRLGELTGHRARAYRLADALQQRLEAIRRRQQGHPALRVFYEIWTQPLITCGKSSFITNLLDIDGLHNVFAGIDQETVRVSVESVVRAKPRIVLVPAGGHRLAARRRFWQRWLGKDVRVMAVNANRVQRPGPRLLAGLEQLQREVPVQP